MVWLITMKKALNMYTLSIAKRDQKQANRKQ